MRIFSSSGSFESLNLSGCCEPRKHMRVADILLNSDEDEEEEEADGYDQGNFSVMADGRGRGEGFRRSLCTSPRLLLLRWLSRIKRLKVKEKLQERCGREGADFGCRCLRMGCLMNGSSGESLSLSSSVKGCNGSSQVVDEPEQNRKDVSFNLGIGFGLMFLIAASKNEVDKMKELRTEMEVILKDAKQEFQRKDIFPKPPETNDNVAYSTTDVEESFYTEGQTSSHVVPNSKTPKYDTPREEESVEGRGQLEAELEAELERLQVKLDTENSSQQERIEEFVEDATPGGSITASSEEVVDPREAGTSELCGGVSPRELERRLHELLEARQEERIKELEAYLERAKHKLQEKEIEVLWWKDTARLITEHVPETSKQLISKHVLLS